VTVPLFAATVAAAAAVLWHHLQSHPGGAWDAVAIWNVKAVFLASAGDAWLGALGTVSPASHPDYPLLVPGTVARAWAVGGTNAWWIAATIAVTFTAATAVLLAGSLTRLRGEAFALAGLALLLTPEFLAQGAAQNADIPLAFFSLAAVVLLADRTPASSRLILAGAACGAAAWTKNEGLVVAAAVPAAFILIVASRRGWRAAWDTASDMAIGLGPLVVLLVVFKLLLAPPNDLMDGLLRPGVASYWFDTQ
jgi:4-amino-4-deoxy-L-arabinose transferase-like glycosyltransferase